VDWENALAAAAADVAGETVRTRQEVEREKSRVEAKVREMADGKLPLKQEDEPRL